MIYYRSSRENCNTDNARRRQQLSAQQRQYTSEFDVANFVKVIPEPANFFKNAARTVNLDHESSHYVHMFLRNRYDRLPIRMIQAVFARKTTSSKANAKISMISVCHEMDKMLQQPSNLMKSRRRQEPLSNNISNIPLLQEVRFFFVFMIFPYFFEIFILFQLAYITHHKEITAYLAEELLRGKQEVREAKRRGLTHTCSCCYDEEVLPRNVYVCVNGCEFCKACIIKSTEVTFGEGKLEFLCLSGCEGGYFTLQTLQVGCVQNVFVLVWKRAYITEIYCFRFVSVINEF